MIMSTKSFLIPLLLVTGILILANLFSREVFFRIDLTEDKQYTLSKATRDILEDLNDPVTIKAYFSQDLPPDVARTRDDFRDLLIEYANISRGMVVYEFINPNENEEKEREAMSAGIQPVFINVREKDQMKQQKAYLGAQISMGEGTESIPFMEPGGGMEYALTTSIKKLAVVDKPSIGFISGNGQPDLSQLAALRVELEILYNVQQVNLASFDPGQSNFKTLVMVRPTDSIPTDQLAKLDQYVQGGGNLVVALNRVDANLQTANGSILSTGTEAFLEKYGIYVSPSFVTDQNCGSVSVQQQQGFFTFNTNISFPFLPIISKFKDHPIGKGLEAVILQFASPIQYNGDRNATWTVLAESSKKSGIVPAPTYFDIQKQWTDADFSMGSQTIAGLLEGNTSSGIPYRIAVISDGDFCIGGGRGQQVQGDNVSLMANSIDYLSDDTGLINLRTRGVVSRPIKDLEEGTKTLLKYLNFGLPILLVILYGVFRAQRRRSIRMKRLEENYG